MNEERRIGCFELNKIYCMDCLEGLKKLPDNSIDLIVTDPPYNLQKDFDNDNLSESEFIDFLTPILREMGRVIKPKHSIILFFDNGKKLPLFWSSLFNSGLHFQRACNLYKPNDCSMPHNRMLRKSEAFFVLSKTPEINHDGDAYMHDCVVMNHGYKEKWYHPTAKDKGVIMKIVRSNSKEGWLVLDNFMGSGTTAVACKQLGRKFLGFEISQKYCDIANKRLEQENILGWVKENKQK